MVKAEEEPILGGSSKTDSFRLHRHRDSESDFSAFVPPHLPEGADEGLQRIGTFGGGVVDDYSRRFPRYLDDIASGVHPKTVSSALFMFFATFFSTVALGVLIQDHTDEAIGTEEYLLMNSLAGMAHALFGCQPLLVLRPTGPITAIITTMYSLKGSFNLDFWQYLAATGMFVGLYMAIVAGFEMSRWIKHLTRFTHEIFAFFVCSIYIHDGISDLVKHFHYRDDDPVAAQLKFGKSVFMVVLALITFCISLWLNGARGWTVFTPAVREFLTDYAVTVAVLVTVGVSYLFGDSAQVDRVSMPGKIQPTYSDPITGEERRWFISFDDAPARLWPLSAASALPIVFFFFMDQNVSSLYCQLPEMGLRKGSYFHSSFLCMGLFNIFGPLFGLPFVTGSLPHSPQFVKALTVYKERSGDQPPRVVKVIETRVAPFLMYLLIGLPVFIPGVLETIPKACIDGILTFVGVAGLFDTQLWLRLVALLQAPRAFPPQFTRLHWTKVHLWTAIQIGILAVCWAVQLSPAGLLFSVVVIAIIPFRRYVVTWIYNYDEEILATMDPAHLCRPTDDDEPSVPSLSIRWHPGDSCDRPGSVA